MATKFVQATNKTTGEKTGLYDTDSPLALFKTLAGKNATTGETMDDWKFDLFDYKGDRLGKYKWQHESVTVTLGDLFD